MLQAELKVIGGAQAGHVIRLKPGKFLIGREPDCQLRPKSELVSRHHCAFAIDEYVLRVRDLGSTNGTFVNGERIRGQVLLQAEDRVRVGSLEFEVRLEQPSPQPTTAEPGDQAAGDTVSFSAMETSVALPASRSAGHETTIINAPPAQAPAPSGDDGMRDILQQAADQEFVVQPEFVAPAAPTTAPRPQPQPVGSPAGTSAEKLSRPTGGFAALPVRLPDPSTTGLKPSVSKPAEGQSGEMTAEENPSDQAAAIIRQFRHRRPTS
ncbi:MAG: FHA domain-containing protein [Planctomycetaceae bacterium]